MTALSGFWIQDFAGGPPVYQDANIENGSAVSSAYPVVGLYGCV